MPHLLSAMLDAPGATWTLRNATRGTLLCTDLQPAFDSASRRKGLLGRDALRPGEGLVIAPCSAVHTFRMRFPIDVVYLARDGRVVATRPELPPARVSASWRAFAVVEVAAGEAAASGTHVGDRLEVVRTAAQPGS